VILIIKQITAEEVWPIRHEVMWPNMSYDFIKLPEDDDGKHFGLFIDNVLTSVVSIFIKEPGIAQFRKFATIEKEQGKGYGTKLLQHLIDYAASKHIRTLWCNARVDKTDYYKKFGLIETNATYTKENIKFVILRKVF
jgi:GNAT superfamily N-acetyltransferase